MHNLARYRGMCAEAFDFLTHRLARVCEPAGQSRALHGAVRPHQGYGNPPLANGLPVDLISISFTDPSGQWLTSTAPPDGAPAITDFSRSQLTVSGPFNQNYYQVVQVDSATLVPPAIEVSPTAGSFLPQQHFDAAVWLPTTGAPVSTMQASVAGTPVALSYPGTCQLAPANSAARPALLCPSADAALI
jgi:hypothetical protein